MAAAPRVRALGSRHSFTDLTDTTDGHGAGGVLVSLADLPTTVEVDASARTARVTGRAAYGEVATRLQAQGWALGNLASLPHISVAGAVATGTHGSGVENGSLAGRSRHSRSWDPMAGSAVWRAVTPTSRAASWRWGRSGSSPRSPSTSSRPTTCARTSSRGCGWEALADQVDLITSSAYSVSLFTRWTDAGIDQVWLKDRVGERSAEPPRELFGALAATATLHMLEGGAIEAITQQGGVPGPWLDRLPHFRMEFTPSRGEELQSEYLLPREHTLEAVERLRALAEVMAPVLMVTELRTVAADSHWLSSSFGHDVVGVHFTWVRDVERVYAVLPLIEDALLPLGARPHWGKCFVAVAEQLEGLYPRLGDFRELRRRVDPEGKFGNAFLDRVIG